MSDDLTVVHGQPSWRIATDDVEAYVTRDGGHLGPVTFERGGRAIQPLSVAPWSADEPGAAEDPLLRVLRGDFFTLPFGANIGRYDGEQHPYHGETAQGRWTWVDQTADWLHLSLDTTIRPGRVDKRITLRPGHSAVYQEHTVSGMSGPMTVGHHAMVRFPDHEGSGRVTTSAFVHGQVYPGDFEPDEGGFTSLQPGAEFDSLERVARADGGVADLSRYPARRGFEDLAMVVADDSLPFAWTAATFADEGYVWLSVRDPRVLRNTILWLSNGGRHYPPWNGRHVAVLGLEDVTGHFHDGLPVSAAPNGLSAAGHPTTVELDPLRPLAVRHLMAVVAIPPGFDAVASVEPGEDPQTAVLSAASGSRVSVPLDLGFVTAGGAGAGAG